MNPEDNYRILNHVCKFLEPKIKYLKTLHVSLVSVSLCCRYYLIQAQEILKSRYSAFQSPMA